MAPCIRVIKSLLLGELRTEQSSCQGPARGGGGSGEEAAQKGLSLSCFLRVTKPT